jgi:hypothetical protein
MSNVTPIRRVEVITGVERRPGLDRRAEAFDHRGELPGRSPNAWLTDALTKLVNRWPARRIDELMPWTYAATL